MRDKFRSLIKKFRLPPQGPLRETQRLQELSAINSFLERGAISLCAKLARIIPSPTNVLIPPASLFLLSPIQGISTLVLLGFLI
jgi:hypothetical protein